MRTPAPDRQPVVLTIAGSGSGDGAGVQADLKTAEACGAFTTIAITVVTAQHTCGVKSTHAPLKEISAQVEAVRDGFAVDAFNTGMLAGAICAVVRHNSC